MREVVNTVFYALRGVIPPRVPPAVRSSKFSPAVKPVQPVLAVRIADTLVGCAHCHRHRRERPPFGFPHALRFQQLPFRLTLWPKSFHTLHLLRHADPKGWPLFHALENK